MDWYRTVALTSDELVSVQEFVDDQFALDLRASEDRPLTGDVAEELLRLAARPQFRRSKLDEESELDIRSKIQMRLDTNKSVVFSVPFGGYKNHESPWYPGPDWADVFSLNYMSRFGQPMADAYAPGVEIVFSYSSAMMTQVSNMPEAACHDYMTRFRALLEVFNTANPSNLRLSAFDVGSLYRASEQENELVANYEDNVERWNDKFSEVERAKRVASAAHNLVVKGAEDLSGLSNREWQARCVDAAMWCEALDSTSLRRKFNKGEHRIQIVFVRGPVRSLHLGSCETSAHHFWSGCGVVEKGRKRLLQRIVSAARLRALQVEGRREDVPVESPIARIAPAFEQIPVASL